MSFADFPQAPVPRHETLCPRFLSQLPNLESTRSRFYHSLELLSFDFTRSGRPGACELTAERPSAAFPHPLSYSCQFPISRSAIGQQIFPPTSRKSRILLPFVYFRAKHRRQALAGQSFLTSPDLIALHHIYTIALHVTYLIRLYRFYLTLCRERARPARLEVRPAPRYR